MPQLERTKRPRIKIGTLVASTNAIQLSCIKALTIVEYYRPISFKRVRRVVITNT